MAPRRKSWPPRQDFSEPGDWLPVESRPRNSRDDADVTDGFLADSDNLDHRTAYT